MSLSKDCTQTSATPATDEQVSVQVEMVNFRQGRDLSKPNNNFILSLETFEAQIDRLAEFIMSEVPGEPSQSQGAVDTAIRLIRASEPVWQDITTAPRDRTEKDIKDAIRSVLTQWGLGGLRQTTAEIVDDVYSAISLPSSPKPLSYEGEQS